MDSRWREHQVYAANHPVRMATIRSKDDVARALLAYMDETKYKGIRKKLRKFSSAVVTSP